MTAGAKPFGYNEVGATKRIFYIADRGLDMLENIVGPFVMHQRRSGRSSALEIHDGLEFLIFNLDQSGRVFGKRAALGHNCRYRLADESRFPRGEDGPENRAAGRDRDQRIMLDAQNR